MPRTPKNEINPDKVLKTGAVLAVGNMLLAPLYYLDAKLGIFTSIALTSAALFQFHQKGKLNRPGGNAINTLNNIFAPYTGDPDTSLLNTVRNVANGGAAASDEASTLISKFLK